MMCIIIFLLLAIVVMYYRYQKNTIEIGKMPLRGVPASNLVSAAVKYLAAERCQMMTMMSTGGGMSGTGWSGFGTGWSGGSGTGGTGGSSGSGTGGTGGSSGSGTGGSTSGSGGGSSGSDGSGGGSSGSDGSSSGEAESSLVMRNALNMYLKAVFQKDMTAVKAHSVGIYGLATKKNDKSSWAPMAVSPAGMAAIAASRSAAPSENQLAVADIDLRLKISIGILLGVFLNGARTPEARVFSEQLIVFHEDVHARVIAEVCSGRTHMTLDEFKQGILKLLMRGCEKHNIDKIAAMASLAGGYLGALLMDVFLPE